MEDRAFRELLTAAERIMAGLDARIADAPPEAVPVFYGIAELHSAIQKANAAIYGTPAEEERDGPPDSAT